MGPYDEAVLTREERAGGLILACAARAKTDTHVAWLGEEATVNLPVQRLRAQVTNIERVTPHVTRIYAWPEYRMKFAAGQFAKLRFADLPARCYSMANRPDEEALEFHIRLLPEGRVSEHVRSAPQGRRHDPDRRTVRPRPSLSGADGADHRGGRRLRPGADQVARAHARCMPAWIATSICSSACATSRISTTRRS